MTASEECVDGKFECRYERCWVAVWKEKGEVVDTYCSSATRCALQSDYQAPIIFLHFHSKSY